MLDYCIAITVLVIALATSWIWAPFLVLTSPFWVTGLGLLYTLLKVLGLWSHVRKAIGASYEWLMFKSNRPRKYLWLKFYNFLVWMFPQPEWKTMNYGYAVNTEHGHTIKLDAEDETERFSYQLYHYIATGMKEFSSLSGLDLIEVGSGRGGGLYYVCRYLTPASAIGVDFSRAQVEFCNRNYKLPNLTYMEGDAMNLPIKAESVDVVINVESAHCYPNLKGFVSEVDRILKPGGHFFFTDFLAASEADELHQALTSASLQVVNKQDITESVLLSLHLDSQRRQELIESRTPRFLHGLLKHFGGTEGSNIYKGMESGETVYQAYHLLKPKPSKL